MKNTVLTKRLPHQPTHNKVTSPPSGFKGGQAMAQAKYGSFIDESMLISRNCHHLPPSGGERKVINWLKQRRWRAKGLTRGLKRPPNLGLYWTCPPLDPSGEGPGVGAIPFRP